MENKGLNLVLAKMIRLSIQMHQVCRSFNESVPCEFKNARKHWAKSTALKLLAAIAVERSSGPGCILNLVTSRDPQLSTILATSFSALIAKTAAASVTTLRFALFLALLCAPASAFDPAYEKLCIFSAAQKLPTIPGLEVQTSRVKDMPQQAVSGMMLVEFDIAAVGQVAKFTYLCAIKPDKSALITVLDVN